MNTKPRLVRSVRRRIENIYPSPENNEIYRPIDRDDSDFIALVASIREKGVLNPLEISLDGYVISGHRRLAAAKMAGLKTVPCRVSNISRMIRRSENGLEYWELNDEFVRLLREHNRQRHKTPDEQLCEAAIDCDPEVAYTALIEARQEQVLEHDLDKVELRKKEKKRYAISEAKKPFLEAAKKVIEDLTEYWPLSVRQVHYKMLNLKVRRHAGKRESVYVNDRRSYQDLDDLLVRARLAGFIPLDCIDDETRPTQLWPTHLNVQPFIAEELDTLFRNYWRDLMADQPFHIEVIAEKLTVASIVRKAVMGYTIPYTISRGFAGLPQRVRMAQRFKKTRKNKLVLLCLSDHDPDGKEITHSYGRSLRDDFGIPYYKLELIQVAVTQKQIDDLNLPPNMLAKKTSANYKRFKKEHGKYAYELEAIDPQTLQGILVEAIDSIIDVGKFNAQIAAEKKESATLEAAKRQVCTILKDYMPKQTEN